MQKNFSLRRKIDLLRNLSSVKILGIIMLTEIFMNLQDKHLLIEFKIKGDK